MRPPPTLSPLPRPLPFQTPGEETANAILHGVGIALAAVGLALLARRGDGPGATACYAAFSGTLISMFLASTLYHALPGERVKRVFQVLDHASVYLLIAGTYTPFSLLGLGGAWGWAYFGAAWALAVAGAALYALNCRPLIRVELAVYLVMGWAIAAALPRLYARIPRSSFALLAAGGAAYTLGTFWYRRRHRRLSHVIWHVHVIAGAACHWLALWRMG